MQNLLEFLFYVFAIWVVVFCLVILFVEIKYSPDDFFLVRPTAKAFWKVYVYFCISVIIVIIFYNIFF